MGNSKFVNNKLHLLLISTAVLITSMAGLVFINVNYKILIISVVAVLSILLLWCIFRVLRNRIDNLTKVTHHLADEGEIPENLSSTKLDIFTPVLKNLLKIDEKIRLSTEYINNIGNGNAADSHQLQDGRLGKALKGMREKMQEIQEEERKRNWVVEGLAKFSEILRNDTHHLEELSFQVISNLVRYTNANQGGFFVEQEDESGGKSLELTASYAYEKRKFLEKKVLAGEGLLGQSILEKEIIYQTEVPENYVNITSGLGKAPPRNLVILPLLMNEEVYGAIELASFHKLAPYQLEFLEKVAENIAATVAAVKVNAHTHKLLEDSQSLAAELRSSEEEMRQNMEELSATQEEMHRKQMELNGVIQAIDATLFTAEMDEEGNIIKTNPALQKLFGYDEASFKTKSYTLFTGDDAGGFWEQIMANNSHSGDFQVRNFQGKSLWLNASFTPVCNTQGNVEKVLMLAQDVTKEKLLRLETQQQQAELKSHMQAINKTIASVAFDLQGKILDVNGIFLGVTGFSEEELIGKQYDCLLTEEEKAKPQTQMMWDNLLNGQSFSGEFKNVDKDGKEMWLTGTYNPIFDTEGKPYKVMMFAQFTTKEKEKQKDLIGTLHALVNSVPVVEVNTEGKIKTANDIFLNLFGYRKMEIIRKELDILLQKPSQEKMKVILPELFEGTEFIEQELDFITVQGKSIHFRATFTAIKNLENEVYKIIVLLLDAGS